MSSQVVPTQDWEADLNAYGAGEDASYLNGEPDSNYWDDAFDDTEIIRKPTRRPLWEDDPFEDEEYWNNNEESGVVDKTAPVEVSPFHHKRYIALFVVLLWVISYLSGRRQRHKQYLRGLKARRKALGIPEEDDRDFDIAYDAAGQRQRDKENMWRIKNGLAPLMDDEFGNTIALTEWDEFGRPLPPKPTPEQLAKEKRERELAERKERFIQEKYAKGESWDVPGSLPRSSDDLFEDEFERILREEREAEARLTEERTRKELRTKQSKKPRANETQSTGLRRRRSDASTAPRSPAVAPVRMASPQYPGPAPPGHFPVEPPIVEQYGSWYPPQAHIVPQTSAPSRPVQPVQLIQYPVAVASVPVSAPSAMVITSEVQKAPSVSSSSKRSKQSKMEVDELPNPDKPEKVHGKKRVATDVDTTEYMELDQDNSEEQARSTKRSKKESQATKKEREATPATTSKPPVRNPAIEQITRAAKRTRAQAASETDTYEPEVARKRLKTETTTELELEPPLTATPSNSRKSQALLANETTPPTVDDVATTQDQEAATPKTWLEADGCTSTDPLCKSRKVGKMWMNRKWGFRVGMDGLRERLCEITVRRKPSRAIRLPTEDDAFHAWFNDEQYTRAKEDSSIDSENYVFVSLEPVDPRLALNDTMLDAASKYLRKVNPSPKPIYPKSSSAAKRAASKAAASSTRIPGGSTIVAASTAGSGSPDLSRFILPPHLAMPPRKAMSQRSPVIPVREVEEPKVTSTPIAREQPTAEKISPVPVPVMPEAPAQETIIKEAAPVSLAPPVVPVFPATAYTWPPPSTPTPKVTPAITLQAPTPPLTLTPKPAEVTPLQPTIFTQPPPTLFGAKPTENAPTSNASSVSTSNPPTFPFQISASTPSISSSTQKPNLFSLGTAPSQQSKPPAIPNLFVNKGSEASLPKTTSAPTVNLFGQPSGIPKSNPISLTSVSSQTQATSPSPAVGTPTPAQAATASPFGNSNSLFGKPTASSPAVPLSALQPSPFSFQSSGPSGSTLSGGSSFAQSSAGQAPTPSASWTSLGAFGTSNATPQPGSNVNSGINPFHNTGTPVIVQSVFTPPLPKVNLAQSPDGKPEGSPSSNEFMEEERNALFAAGGPEPAPVSSAFDPATQHQFPFQVASSSKPPSVVSTPALPNKTITPATPSSSRPIASPSAPSTPGSANWPHPPLDTSGNSMDISGGPPPFTFGAPPTPSTNPFGGQGFGAPSTSTARPPNPPTGNSGNGHHIGQSSDPSKRPPQGATADNRIYSSNKRLRRMLENQANGINSPQSPQIIQPPTLNTTTVQQQQPQPTPGFTLNQGLTPTAPFHFNPSGPAFNMFVNSQQQQQQPPPPQQQQQQQQPPSHQNGLGGNPFGMGHNANGF